jgi:hypothetical protein
MLERGRVPGYQRGNRAEVGLGMGEFLSLAGWMVIEEGLQV